MRVVLSLLAALIALSVGILAFIAVFYTPVVIYGDYQVLLLWGWITPFVGLPVGAWAARLAYWSVNGLLVRSFAAESHRWFKMSLVGAVALAGTVSVAHLMRTHGDVTVAWSEEVRLNDGSLIVVSRQALGNVFGHPKSEPEAWLPSEFVIHVSSVPALSGTPPWRSSTRPLVLDKDPSTSTWYILAEPVDCAKWHTMGQPNPPYALYVHDSKAWTRKAMSARYIGLPANLLVAPRFKGEDEIVTVEAGQARNNWGPADHRPIIRAKSRC